MNKLNILKELSSNLIVSCQALYDEPLHSSFIMGKMALAAKLGGAKGIRANGKSDISEIKKNVDLPIIGIVKKNYNDSNVYITPTIKEVDELVSENVEIIAVQATNDLRPKSQTLKNFYNEIRSKYKSLILMADCSTLEEAVFAEELGFDIIATTLFGYTSQSQNRQIYKNNFATLKEMLNIIKKPIIAEGNINTPKMAKTVLELGCHSVVVGSMITRPKIITESFINEISKANKINF